MIFQDREDAGKQLAQEIEGQLELKNPYVIALPRGGVPVGHEVAKIVRAPLDVIIVRKLGVPHHPEFAFGAIAPGGVELIDEALVQRLELNDKQINQVISKEKQEMKRRIEKYRGNLDYPDLSEKEVIMVDDGIATGATFEVAVKYVKKLQPKKVILAVPISSSDSLDHLESLVDETVCLHSPADFSAVGQFYYNFGQTSDEEVLELLKQNQKLQR